MSLEYKDILDIVADNRGNTYVFKKLPVLSNLAPYYVCLRITLFLLQMRVPVPRVFIVPRVQ